MLLAVQWILGTLPTLTVALTHEQADALFAQAKEAYGKGAFAQSVTHFRALKAALPDWKENYLNLASAELQRGDGNAMLGVYREAYERFPTDPAFADKYCDMLVKTFHIPGIEQPANRIDVCTKALSLNAKKRQNYLNLSDVFKQKGDMNSALDVYQPAVKRFPNDAVIYRAYCSLFADIMDSFYNHPTVKIPPDAFPICYKAVEMLPDDSDILQKLALSLKVSMQHEPAIAAYELWLEKFRHLNVRDTLHIKSTLAKALINGGKRERANLLAEECLAVERNLNHLSTLSLVRAIGWPYDEHGWKIQGEVTELAVQNFDIKNPDICPGGTWRVAYNYTNEAALHPDRLSLVILNPDTAYSTYGREDDPIFVGPHIDKYPHLFHEKSVYLVFFENVYMTGLNGVPHGDCTVYAGSHHNNIGLQTFATTDAAPIVEIEHRAASIILHQMQNYYHWVSEVLPKLLLMKEHVLEKAEYADVKVVVPTIGVARALEKTLELEEFQFLKGRLIYFENPTSTRYHFKKGLFVVDWLHPENDMHGTLSKSQWSIYWSPSFVHTVIRPFFHSALQKRNRLPHITPLSPSKPGSIVYIRRTGTVRSFLNEQELVAYLSARFGPRLRVHNGEEDILDQVEMFAGARVVVGNHGAGLTNYMFTQAGAVLVAIPKDPMVDFCFANMVAGMRGRHIVVSEIPGAHYVGQYPPISQNNMVLLGNVIDQALVLSAELKMGDDHDEL